MITTRDDHIRRGSLVGEPESILFTLLFCVISSGGMSRVHRPLSIWRVGDSRTKVNVEVRRCSYVILGELDQISSIWVSSRGCTRYEQQSSVELQQIYVEQKADGQQGIPGGKCKVFIFIIKANDDCL